MNKQLYNKRKEHRKTQKDMALMLGISPQSFHLRESGKAEFRMNEALRVTVIFKCTLDDLFGERRVF